MGITITITKEAAKILGVEDLVIKRVQRKRIKGWTMPENTVYVGRPTPFGNPFKITIGNETAVQYYERFLEVNPELVKRIKKELRGKNLACFCHLNKECHADILLKIANT